MPHSGKRAVRYAIVGLGHIAQVAMLPAFAHARRNSRLTALVSDDRTKLKELARRYGVDSTFTYNYYDACLEQVDAVYIALPNSMHAEYAIRAARAGVHVLCEKPMAVTVAECRAMITACRRAEVAQLAANQVDGSTWTIPAAVTKNATVHRVHLTDLALEQLPAPRDDGRYFARGISWSRCKWGLDRASNVHEWTLHDLRRTAAARIAATTPPHIVEALLNHRPPVLVRTSQVADRWEDKRAAWTA